MKISRKSFVASPLALIPLGASAQSFPDKPVTVIHGFEPGGGADLLIRAVIPDVSQILGQQIVMKYRPGAGGNLAIADVSHAAPDGYTLLLGTPGLVTNPYVYAEAKFDVLHEYAPVTLIGTTQNVLVVNDSLPVNSVRELVALAKAKPGQLNYASSGVGTSLHLDGELFKLATKIDIVHIPYKGGLQAQTAVLAGQVSMMFNVLPSALPLIKSRKIKALAVTGKTRDDALPDVPTMIQAGVPGYVAITWNGILAPAGTPKDVVGKLNNAFVQALKRTEVKQRLSAMGQEPAWDTPEEFGSFLGEEKSKWAKVIAAAGIKPQ